MVIPCQEWESFCYKGDGDNSSSNRSSSVLKEESPWLWFSICERAHAFLLLLHPCSAEEGEEAEEKDLKDKQGFAE